MKENIFYEKDNEINELYNKEFSKFSQSAIITKVYLDYLDHFISDGMVDDDENLLNKVKSINECIDIQLDSYNKIKTLNKKYPPSEIFNKGIEEVKKLVNSNNEMIEKLNSTSPKQIKLNYYPI
ncbi:hypothetical protein [Methanobrevibacter sp.]|uniref:hypothetical protein n=1 Tax=Methanobrevibacter sp. TaxID=66852 RepID=UPI00386BFBD3